MALSNFTSKVKKALGGGPSTIDQSFEASRREFKNVYDFVNAIHSSLQKRVKNLKKTFIHVDCVSKVIIKYLNGDHPLTQNAIESSKLIENSFNNWNESQKDNYESIGRTVARMKSIKDSISTRDQYLVDLESSDSKLKSLKEKPQKDSSKLPAEENNNRQKKLSYQQKNQSTLEEIHQFFEDKNNVFDIPLMQIQESLSALFFNIHNNLIECAEVLQKSPPKTNPISTHLENLSASYNSSNNIESSHSHSSSPSSLSKSPSFSTENNNQNNYYDQEYQPTPSPVQSPPVQEPQLQGPPIDLEKLYGPFTKKSLLVHNDILFPEYAQQQQQQQQPPQQQFSQPSQPVSLKTAPTRSSFNNNIAAPQPVQPNPNSQVAKSGSFLRPTQPAAPQQTQPQQPNPPPRQPTPPRQQSPPPTNQINSNSGVLPSQINKANVKPISFGIVTKPAASAQQQAPPPPARQPSPPQQQPLQQQQPAQPTPMRSKSFIQQQPPQQQPLQQQQPAQPAPMRPKSFIQQPPQQQQQQPLQQQPTQPAPMRPKSIIQQQPPQQQNPTPQRQPTIPQQPPPMNKLSNSLTSLASAAGLRSNSKTNLSPATNFARHRELYGPHKKFKLVPTFTRSVIGTYDFGYQCPQLQPKQWSVIMPAPPTAMNQNVRSSGLEIYDHNQNWLVNGELLTTDYHYVFRALVPTTSFPSPQDANKLRGRYIIEADLYRIDMVECSQWEHVEPLQPEELDYYTRASNAYTLDDPVFLDFINKNNLTIQPQNGAEPAETPLCFAYRVNLFIHHNFKYNYETGWKPITTTIQIGKGDCGCLALLYNAIMRKSGLPSRSVIGRGGDYTSGDGVGPHCKSEVWIDNIGWMPVDVTWNLHHPDPTNKYFGNDCGELIVFHMDEVCNIDTGVSSKSYDSCHLMQCPLYFASTSGGSFEGNKRTDQWTVKPI